MPLMVKDVMKMNFIDVNENLSIKKSVDKMVSNKVKIILVKNSDEIIGIIRENEIYDAIMLDIKPSMIKVNEIMSDNFRIIGEENILDGFIERMINNKLEPLLVVKSTKGEVIGTISINELGISYARNISNVDHIYINLNRQVRHDLRGYLFTINTAISLIERSPEKMTQILEIMKKTLQSMNKTIEYWKNTES